MERFERALLQPRIPQLLEELQKKHPFCVASSPPFYTSHIHERGGLPFIDDSDDERDCETPSEIERLVSMTKRMRQKCRARLAEMLSEEAAQNLGFARVVRLCHIEHQGGLQSRGQRAPTLASDMYDVGALWTCDCCFPNEDFRVPKCSVCGAERKQSHFTQRRYATPPLKYVPLLCVECLKCFNRQYFRDFREVRRVNEWHAEPLPPCEAMKLIRKKMKKIKIVRILPITFASCAVVCATITLLTLLAVGLQGCWHGPSNSCA
jgi:hypothetical protein